MSVQFLYTTQTNTQTATTPTLEDIHRISRSLKRSLLIRRYSRGTTKRSAMAMINHYMRLARHNFMNQSHDLHAVM